MGAEKEGSQKGMARRRAWPDVSTILEGTPRRCLLDANKLSPHVFRMFNVAFIESWLMCSCGFDPLKSDEDVGRHVFRFRASWGNSGFSSPDRPRNHSDPGNPQGENGLLQRSLFLEIQDHHLNVKSDSHKGHPIFQSTWYLQD